MLGAVKKYVIYRRCSTRAQSKSGLGLEAQSRDIDLFLTNYSDSPYEILGTFTEVESGKNADRPVLAQALAMARENGAELLVAKLDRLSRRVSQIATLMEDKQLSIRVASMPYADPFQLHLYAALSEQERRFISLRTKQALARSTKKLGGLRESTKKRNEAAKAAADAAANRISSIIVPMRDNGSTLQRIADALNAAGVPTPRNRQWKAMSVKNALDRLQAA